MDNSVLLSERLDFQSIDWKRVPAEPGVYVIYQADEAIYVGMSGRNGKGNLRNRLRDHSSGQIVNMFAQYLFLARVQFIPDERIAHPRDAKAACHAYIQEHCSFSYAVTRNGAEARRLEDILKKSLEPSLNP